MGRYRFAGTPHRPSRGVRAADTWLQPWIRAHLDTLPADCPYLFPNREGCRYSSSRCNFNWSEKKANDASARPSALEIAGIERRIRFHDLRGTYATHLALGTWGRQWSLKDPLAHAGQRTTERYVRRAIDHLSEAARDTILGPGVPDSSPAPQTGTGPSHRNH